MGNRLEAPNEGDWGGKVLASDFPFIAKRGFDHVRIPMKWSGHAQTGAPYTIDSSFFSPYGNRGVGGNLGGRYPARS
jgi:endoglucanase